MSEQKKKDTLPPIVPLPALSSNIFLEVPSTSPPESSSVVPSKPDKNKPLPALPSAISLISDTTSSATGQSEYEAYSDSLPEYSRPTSFFSQESSSEHSGLKVPESFPTVRKQQGWDIDWVKTYKNKGHTDSFTVTLHSEGDVSFKLTGTDEVSSKSMLIMFLDDIRDEDLHRYTGRVRPEFNVKVFAIKGTDSHRDSEILNFIEREHTDNSLSWRLYYISPISSKEALVKHLQGAQKRQAGQGTGSEVPSVTVESTPSSKDTLSSEKM